MCYYNYQNSFENKWKLMSGNSTTELHHSHPLLSLPPLPFFSITFIYVCVDNTTPFVSQAVRLLCMDVVYKQPLVPQASLYYHCLCFSDPLCFFLETVTVWL